jgi:hypothetical protein
MKPGNIVSLRADRVAVQLLSDSVEKMIDLKSSSLGGIIDNTWNIAFRRGEVATVVEVNQQNKARVKIFYKSGVWWGNVSDMYVIE